MPVKFPEESAKQSKDEDYRPPRSGYTSLDLDGTYTYDDSREVMCLTYNHTGDKVAVGYNDAGVELLDVSTGKPKIHKVIKKRQYGGFPVGCIRYHPIDPDKLFIGSSNGNMYTCNVNDPDTWNEEFTEKSQSRTKQMEKNEIHTFDFSADGKEFCTGGKDLHVRLYDTETLQQLRMWEGYDINAPKVSPGTHAQRIFCLKYMRHHLEIPELRNTFVTGGWDNTIKIWDNRMKNAMKRKIPGPHVCGDSIDFLGYKMLVGAWCFKDALKIFDLRASVGQDDTLPFHVAHKQEEDHEDIGEYIYCARFYDPDTVVAGGSGTHSIQAISISDSVSENPVGNPIIGEMKLCSQSEKVVTSLDTHPEGKQLVFGGRGDKLHVASLSGTGCEQQATL